MIILFLFSWANNILRRILRDISIIWDIKIDVAAILRRYLSLRTRAFSIAFARIWPDETAAYDWLTAVVSQIYSKAESRIRWRIISLPSLHESFHVPSYGTLCVGRFVRLRMTRHEWHQKHIYAVTETKLDVQESRSHADIPLPSSLSWTRS